MKIGLICHLKFPIARPYCGGLEMFTHALAECLIARGHDVTLFASGDSDPALNLRPVVPEATVPRFADFPEATRATAVDNCEDRAYARLLRRIRGEDFDVLHNNTLNPVVLKSAAGCRAPLLTTLHVPPLPRLVSAMKTARCLRRLAYVNVSGVNRDNWRVSLPKHRVCHNGVNTDVWRPSGEPVRRRAVWTGRILPDKGTHYAVEAAHAAGLPIDLAGPVNDEAYFREQVEPRLRPEDRYHGLMEHADLAKLVGTAAVSLCTPCWDEPFGLVVSEALACGTPVASFDRGGPAEIINAATGRLSRRDDAADLGRAATECLSLDRADCRRRAETHFSIEAMVRRYERLYESLLPTPQRPAPAVHYGPAEPPTVTLT